MDKVDKKIIEIVQVQGQISYAELGKEVGLSVSAINERLKKLQNNKIIRGWGARIDPKAVGLEVLAFVFIQHERPVNEINFRAELVDFPEIEECHHVTGEWSYLVKIRVKSISDLEDLLTYKIRATEGVLRTQTVIALSSPKDWTPLKIG